MANGAELSALSQLPVNAALAGGDVAASARRLAALDADTEATQFSLKRAHEIAKGFESMFLHRLLAAMKETIQDSDLMGDGISKQYKDIFWFHMAEMMAEGGGTGLGEQVYRDILRTQGVDNAGAKAGRDDSSVEWTR